MGERLREIAQVLATGSEFLRVKSYVIGITDHSFKKQTGFIQLPRARKAFDVPEGAHGEGSLGPLQTIHSAHYVVIAVHQRIFRKVGLDLFQRAEPTWVDGADEPHQWHEISEEQ